MYLTVTVCALRATSGSFIPRGSSVSPYCTFIFTGSTIVTFTSAGGGLATGVEAMGATLVELASSWSAPCRPVPQF